MNPKYITLINQLPRRAEWHLYNGPFFSIQKEKGMSETDHAINCSVKLFRKKYGEPGSIYVLRTWVFIAEDKDGQA